MTVHPRLGCSTITFRRQEFREALASIAELGFAHIDIGALPGVCDHVTVPFHGDPDAVADAASAAGLRVCAVNADPGDLNDPHLSDADLARVLGPLIDTAAACGASLVLPCGKADREPLSGDLGADLDQVARRLLAAADQAAEHGVRVLVEAPHFHRLAHSTERAADLLSRLPAERIGLVFDTSHVSAGGADEVSWVEQNADRIEHVHLRDALPGDINIGIGRGRADFPGVLVALEEAGYQGDLILELETRDVAETDRAADAARSRDLVGGLLTHAEQGSTQSS
ncbi:sugar phosphate isomerase/epimerase family protein [Nocardiopsis sp. NPDC006938]|uniref:sugar phosphate isomerase/epimerase family protein n=1 Tax=Nocardiopsis sp. NPDC006938 TaxID=3364337 RepID=UPI003696F3C9